MNIDFSNLSKEQKQYLFLGILGVAAVGYGLFIGISKVGGSLSEAKVELEELNTKIDRAERELGRRSEALSDFDQTITVLESHLDNLPPEENYYSWATEIIYSKGRNAGLQVESVDEVGMDASKAGKMKDPVYFETYSLRIVARGDYAATKAFINDIEKNHPLVRFTGVDISRGRDPEKHAVQLSVQWPHKLQRITALWKDRRRESAPVAVAKAARPEPAPVPASPVKPAEQAEAASEEADASGPKVTANPEPDYTPPAPVVVRRKTEPVVKPVPPAPAPEKVEPEVVKTEPKKESAPMVVRAEPAPAPVPETVEPKVVKTEPKEVPAPVIVQAEPTPAPVPETVEPKVVKTEPKEVPAPVVVQAEPAPAPVPETVEPEVVKTEPKEVPAPVIVQAEPTPAPVPETVEPEVVKTEPKEVPAPVIVQAEPTPAPVPETVEPKVVKTEPKKVPAPLSSTEPDKGDDVMADLLSSIDRVQSAEEEEQSKERPAVDDQMASLLASLNSHGSTESAEAPVVLDPVAVSSAQDLQNYVNELAVQTEPVEAEEDGRPETIAVEPPKANDVDLPVVYVSSGKSAKILEDLLMKDKPEASKTLGSFLDGIVGDINENR